jgi:hypothetical protein
MTVNQSGAVSGRLSAVCSGLAIVSMLVLAALTRRLDDAASIRLFMILVPVMVIGAGMGVVLGSRTRRLLGSPWHLTGFILGQGVLWAILVASLPSLL